MCSAFRVYFKAVMRLIIFSDIFNLIIDLRGNNYIVHIISAKLFFQVEKKVLKFRVIHYNNIE